MSKRRLFWHLTHRARNKTSLWTSKWKIFWTFGLWKKCHSKDLRHLKAKGKLFPVRDFCSFFIKLNFGTLFDTRNFPWMNDRSLKVPSCLYESWTQNYDNMKSCRYRYLSRHSLKESFYFTTVILEFATDEIFATQYVITSSQH